MQGATAGSEHVRLLAESRRIRGEAVRVRIAAVHAYCSVVESEGRWGSAAKAEDCMGKVWRVVAELKRHLAEPQHVPAEATGELLTSLAGLEERALRLHQSLCGLGAGPLWGRAQGGSDPQTSR